MVSCHINSTKNTKTCNLGATKHHYWTDSYIHTYPVLTLYNNTAKALNLATNAWTKLVVDNKTLPESSNREHRHQRKRMVYATNVTFPCCKCLPRTFKFCSFALSRSLPISLLKPRQRSFFKRSHGQFGHNRTRSV